MIDTLTEEQWQQYESQGYLRLGQVLTDEELTQIQNKLFEQSALAKLWGFRPSMKTRSELAIRRVAANGDSENRSLNRTLARQPRNIMPVVAPKARIYSCAGP